MPAEELPGHFQDDVYKTPVSEAPAHTHTSPGKHPNLTQRQSDEDPQQGRMPNI